MKKKCLQNTANVNAGDLCVVELWISLSSFCLSRVLEFFAINGSLIKRQKSRSYGKKNHKKVIQSTIK